ncbi:MAG TPA: lipoyl synthase [Candidatus Adamsella sp.]|nr:lipoyl synthase [Candidatus Adamsella sp.]
MKQRLPEYLRRGIIDTDATRKVRRLLKESGLTTVCDAARCPNRNECYSCNSATFMILGDRCTRNCRFCSVTTDKPLPPNPQEPELVANAIKELGLKYAVITMVTRDDLPDGGAEHISKTIREIKKINPQIKTEVLISDMQGNKEALKTVLEASPDVLNHNVETVKALYKTVRPQADYIRSLGVLKFSKEYAPHIITKTGIMLGLGETEPEILELFDDLVSVKCDILTAGQYIQPTKQHIEVKRYLAPDEFESLQKKALASGLKQAVFAPLARSSYKASEAFYKIKC